MPTLYRDISAQKADTCTYTLCTTCVQLVYGLCHLLFGHFGALGRLYHGADGVVRPHLNSEKGRGNDSPILFPYGK